MHCNLKRLLEAIVNGASSFSLIKQQAPGVRNPQHKLATLIETGHVEIDPNGLLQPTDKARKVVSGEQPTE